MYYSVQYSKIRESYSTIVPLRIVCILSMFYNMNDMTGHFENLYMYSTFNVSPALKQFMYMDMYLPHFHCIEVTCWYLHVNPDSKRDILIFSKFIQYIYKWLFR